jgi:hypothetical protein
LLANPNIIRKEDTYRESCVLLPGQHLGAEAGEGLGVLGVDGGFWGTAWGTTSWATTATGRTVPSRATESTTLATEVATLTALASTARSIATATAAASRVAWLLNEALVNLDELLLLALTGALGLARSGGDESLLLTLLELAGGVPLLVRLGTLVGLAGSSGGERELLGLLDEVVGVRDRVILLLLFKGAAISVDGSGVAVLSQGDLAVGLGESVGSVLISGRSLASLTTPAVSDLLVRVTTTC